VLEKAQNVSAASKDAKNANFSRAGRQVSTFAFAMVKRVYNGGKRLIQQTNPSVIPTVEARIWTYLAPD
jgi:hypothetical protein